MIYGSWWIQSSVARSRVRRERVLRDLNCVVNRGEYATWLYRNVVTSMISFMGS
jgi:hypothetical protein